MANSYLSISCMPQFYSLICSYFVLFFSCMFSRNLYVSNLVKIMYILHHKAIVLQPSTVSPTRFLHNPGDHKAIVEAEEEETRLRSSNIHNYGDDANYKYDKNNVTLCVESGENNCRNGGGGYGSSRIGCTREGEEWKITLTRELLEERHYNKVQGEEGMDMDWLWEAFEADSIKSRRVDVGLEEKDTDKKTSGEGDDEECVEEDEQVEMRNGCLQGFRCCSARRGARRSSSSIVKISKPLNMASWWRHFKRRVAKTKILISDYE